MSAALAEPPDLMRPGKSGAKGPAGDLAVALAHARRLLEDRPALALVQAREILRIHPRSAEAWRLGGRAASALGDIRTARDMLASAARLDPVLPCVWLALGQAHAALGEADAAVAARLRHVESAVFDTELLAAADALAENRLDLAERGLRVRLKAEPDDIAALRMLGELAARLGRYADAELLLARALEVAPEFAPARYNRAQVLYRQGKGEATLTEVARLRAQAPDDPNYLMLEAGALALVGDYARAVSIYEALLERHPDQPKVWLTYGHALKTLGRREACVAAYRRCIDLAPGQGEAWWSLANVKTVRFTAAERRELARRADAGGLADEDQLHFDYALGKALEDEGEDDGAFARYAHGAAIQKRRLGYDAQDTTAQVRRLQAAFTAPVFARHDRQGAPDADPIFIVGLPRSGSTLVEQILASHSRVEGTMELSEMSAVARRAGELLGGAAYPEAVDRLTGDQLAELGRFYLESTRIYRKTDRPLFIDKMPNNWMHAGLIRLILPNARIIDARRHPLGACFSAFKQHFARGQAFSYDLTDLGLYYRDYAGFMASLDREAPRAVHRVSYEAMVEDTEAQVRRLLEVCGLDFEPACLRFHETSRAVRTASAEQVRQPIYREGLDHWRRFERHLVPLKAALGPWLDAYPAAPG